MSDDIREIREDYCERDLRAREYYANLILRSPWMTMELMDKMNAHLDALLLEKEFDEAEALGE